METLEKLYFVDVNDAKNQLLALKLEIRHEENKSVRVSFFDTNRGRGFHGQILNQDEQSIVFRTEQGDNMTFRVATILEYDLIWRAGIEGSVPNFRLDEDLHRWYYNQFLS